MRLRVALVMVSLLALVLWGSPTSATSSAGVTQVFVLFTNKWPMWIGNITLCPADRAHNFAGVYLVASGGEFHPVPAYQLRVNGSVIDVGRFFSRDMHNNAYVYIELERAGDGVVIHPFNVTVGCNTRVLVRGDVHYYVVRDVSDGQLLDHKRYSSNGLRLIPYPHTFNWWVSAWGSLNYPGGYTRRYNSVVKYRIVVKTDAGTVADRVMDSGYFNFTLRSPPSYIDAYSYAVIHNDTGEASNSTINKGTLKKPSPIDFSSIYNALGGSHSAVPIIALVAIVAAVAILRR